MVRRDLNVQIRRQRVNQMSGRTGHKQKRSQLDYLNSGAKTRIRNFTTGTHVCQLLYRNARYISPVTKVLKVNLKLIPLAFHITVNPFHAWVFGGKHAFLLCILSKL